MHQVVCDDEQRVGHSSRGLVLNEIWDHASRVHLHDMLEVDAAIIGLPAHPSQLIVRHNIAINLRLLFLHDCLVALARVEDHFCAIFLLMVVKACYSASVGDEHWHLHFQETHAVSLVVRKFNASQLVVAGLRYDSRVGCPLAPLFLS